MYSKIFNKYLSTFLFCLPFIGYQLATSLFLQDSAMMEDEIISSRSVTVPYRAFVLGLSIIMLMVNIKKEFFKNKDIVIFLVFWGLLLIRIFYDLEYQTEHPVNKMMARQTWLFVLFICLTPTLAVIKSMDCIDLKLAFFLILFGYVFLIPVFYINNPLLFSTEGIGRISGNLALNTISFGHWGGALSLLSFFAYKNSKKLLFKVFFIGLMITGFFVLLRAGSRGPLVALGASMLFYYSSRQKHVVLSMLVMFLLLMMLYLFSDFLFEWIRSISSVLANRLTLSSDITSSYEEFSNGRASLYSIAIENIINNPILGSSFAVFREYGSYIYSHNIILDAFMGLGFFGGILFLIILFKALAKSRDLIKERSPYFWLGLLAVQQIVAHMFSGAFYQSDILNVLLVVLFIIPTPPKQLSN